MRLFRPSVFFRCFYPEALFRVKTKEKILYLTFDDGPDPESTPCLLNILDSFDIKAIFFCSGKAAEKYPELIGKIKSKGHIIGNHGYSHLNGLKTPAGKYCEDVRIASDLTSDRIFRPPYGRISIRQYRRLRKFFSIVLWDIMPYDFDDDFGASRALNVLKKLIRPGSVIVLHDNPDSSCKIILKEFLENSIRENFRFGLPELK